MLPLSRRCIGGTDSVRYEEFAIPFCVFVRLGQHRGDEANGVHGIDERMKNAFILQGVRVLISFVKQMLAIICYL